ncbi:MAG: hypothetical protein WCI63_03630 [bacterium]
MGNEEIFEASAEHIRFMDRLCKKLPRCNRRIRVTKKECYPHQRRHHSFSIKEIGDFFVATVIYDGAMMEFTAKRSLSRGDFKKAFQEAYNYAI